MATANRSRFFEVIDDVTWFLAECFNLDHELPKGLEATVLVRDRKSQRRIASTKVVGSKKKPTKGANLDAMRPFARLPELPDDLSDAFESFKLAIVRHKLDGWSEISREDLLLSLDALKDIASKD